MGAALPIIQMIIQYGIPAALQIAQLWHKQQPDNVEVGEWVALLTVLSKSYKDYVPDANPNAPFPPLGTGLVAGPSPNAL